MCQHPRHRIGNVGLVDACDPLGHGGSLGEGPQSVADGGQMGGKRQTGEDHPTRAVAPRQHSGPHVAQLAIARLAVLVQADLSVAITLEDPG